jgi:hypothetical protein
MNQLYLTQHAVYMTKAIHISFLTENTDHIPHVFFHYILNRRDACAPHSIPGHSMSNLVTISISFHLFYSMNP